MNDLRRLPGFRVFVLACSICAGTASLATGAVVVKAQKAHAASHLHSQVCATPEIAFKDIVLLASELYASAVRLPRPGGAPRDAARAPGRACTAADFAS